MRLIAYMCPFSLEIDISSSFVCISGKKTVENLKIWHGQLAPCQEIRIKGQQTMSSAGCKVLASNAGFLLASMPSYCRFRPKKCCYSRSVSVSVPHDKIRGSVLSGKTIYRRALYAGEAPPPPPPMPEAASSVDPALPGSTESAATRQRDSTFRQLGAATTAENLASFAF